MKKYSTKTLEKRKEERACLPKFFKKHVEVAKNNYCEECGEKLTGNVSEIAHILPKQTFKSIMCNDLNVVYLCGMWSRNQCHNNFDSFPQEKVKNMNIYPKIVRIFAELEEHITEKISFKVYDKYTE